ncbi:MAG: carbohydrate kinase family protein [Anaerolineaceae bacterium]|nr:carbohydrate kinase family protein [Anaerolineaceae bacterium]
MNENYSVFIGDVALDEYYRADYWPTIKDKAHVDALPAVPGGMIANAACVSASLGMNVKFVSVLNSGSITKYLLEDLKNSRVDTSLVIFDDSLADSKTMIFLVGDEHTIFIPRLGLESIEITTEQLDVLAKADFIYTTPSEIAAVRCGDMISEDIIDHCRANGAKLVFDLDVDYIKDGDEERFKRLDIAFFNEVGFDSYRGSLNYQSAADRLLSYGLELVIVTLAGEGCIVYTQDQTIRSPGFKVEVVDVTGAGDTFCSSFLYALSSGNDIKYAAEFANAAASICVGKLGARAGAVSRDEVERIMRL